MLSKPIEADLYYTQFQDHISELMDLMDEEILSRPGHDERLGQIGSGIYLLRAKLKTYRALVEPPFDGQEWEEISDANTN